MRCRFSPLAELDLEEIGDYIARDNPPRALSFIEEIRARCFLIYTRSKPPGCGKTSGQVSVLRRLAAT